MFANSFGVPNALLSHLLDAYSEGMRRDDRFNGGICARIDNAAYMLTPDDDLFADDPISVAHGSAANQIGYPSGGDRCWCTGHGQQIRCSQSGTRSCAHGESCVPMPPRAFGDWAMCQ